MSQWFKKIKVGTGSPFGERECDITYFHGRVVQVNCSNIPITHISGGGGRIHGSTSISNGYGSGYLSGSIDPIRSHTEICTEFKMWVRSREKKDFSWSANYALDVVQGQILTLILLNGKMVAFANHNLGSLQYVSSDEEIADLIGQRGYILVNKEEIERGVENGTNLGLFVGALLFWSIFFIEKPGSWGWPWIKLWYILPGIVLLWAIAAKGNKSKFWVALILGLSVSFGLCIYGGMPGLLVASLIPIAAITLAEGKYRLIINTDAVSRVKQAISSNATYAFHAFRF